MDDLRLAPPELERALKSLSRMHLLSMSSFSLSRAIIRLIDSENRVVRILDLGSGRGDVLCATARHLRHSGIRLCALGTDMNPQSVRIANKYATEHNSDVRFECATASDALRANEFDIAISSLFMHHCSESQLLELFAIIREKATIGMVMSDLTRSALGYALTWAATHALSTSHVVRYDGLASVEAAFTRGELETLATKAGLSQSSVSSSFPLRLMLAWKRHASAPSPKRLRTIPDPHESAAPGALPTQIFAGACLSSAAMKH